METPDDLRKCPAIYENTRRFMEIPDGLRKHPPILWVPARGRAMPAPTRCVPFLSIFGFCACLHAATARRGPTGAYRGPMWASAPTHGISVVRFAGGQCPPLRGVHEFCKCLPAVMARRGCDGFPRVRNGNFIFQLPTHGGTRPAFCRYRGETHWQTRSTR